MQLSIINYTQPLRDAEQNQHPIIMCPNSVPLHQPHLHPLLHFYGPIKIFTTWTICLHLGPLTDLHHHISQCPNLHPRSIPTQFLLYPSVPGSLSQPIPMYLISRSSPSTQALHPHHPHPYNTVLFHIYLFIQIFLVTSFFHEYNCAYL